MHNTRPITLGHFLHCFAITVHALTRTFLVTTGLHYTRAGRRLYR